MNKSSPLSSLATPSLIIPQNILTLSENSPDACSITPAGMLWHIHFPSLPLTSHRARNSFQYFPGLKYFLRQALLLLPNLRCPTSRSCLTWPSAPPASMGLFIPPLLLTQVLVPRASLYYFDCIPLASLYLFILMPGMCFS